MNRRTGILIMLLFCSSLLSQEKKTEKDAKDLPTIKIPVDVVVVNVTVVDKQGKPVTDLQRDEFRIYEDGKPQSIQTFALESYGPAQAGKNESPNHGAADFKLNRPRMISLILDDSTVVSNENYPAVAKAMTQFVEQDIGPNDLVAISATSGNVQFPFTDRKPTLHEEIRELFKKCNRKPDNMDCPQFSNLESKRILDDFYDYPGGSNSIPLIKKNPPSLDTSGKTPSAVNKEPFKINEEAIYSTQEKCRSSPLMAAISELLYSCPSISSENPALAVRRIALNKLEESRYKIRELLNALRQHMGMLRYLDAPKVVILFSNGYYADSDPSYSHGLQETIEQALLSGVVFNTVDIQGLNNNTSYPWERLSIIRSPDPTMPESNCFVFHFNGLITRKSKIKAEEQIAVKVPLSQIAADTGGLFHHDNNDLYQGIRNVIQRQYAYYVLTYARPQQKADGKYHHIKVKVLRGKYELSFRKGYYTSREALTITGNQIYR
jgi:VWFA-related protein